MKTHKRSITARSCARIINKNVKHKQYLWAIELLTKTRKLWQDHQNTSLLTYDARKLAGRL